MSQKVSHQEIVEALQSAAQSYGAKMMAAELGKAPSTLYGELNPYITDEEKRHKLGLQDAMAIMSITGDVQALHLMCAAHGYEARPVGAEPVETVVAYQTFGAVVSEVGDLADALRHSLADGRLSHAERMEIAQQAREITQALAPFLAV